MVRVAPGHSWVGQNFAVFWGSLALPRASLVCGAVVVDIPVRSTHHCPIRSIFMKSVMWRIDGIEENEWAKKDSF
jgi:hypothetical protein